MMEKDTGYRATPVDTRIADLEPECRRYVSRGYRQVEGWLPKLAVLEIARLAQLQRIFGIAGPVVEIGVHHGRALILLYLLTRPGEIAVGIDLYEILNEARGRARKARLLSNVNAHHGDLRRIKVISEDSLNLSAERILELCAGRPRLFSIDGGRTPDIIYNDLRLARATVCEGGIVMVEDYFGETWPGVSEGVCRFMFSEPGLHPMAIGGNKIFFTNSHERAAAYRDGLASTFDGRFRRATMFGEPVLVIGRLTFRTRIARAGPWKAVRDTALGRVLRMLAARVAG